MANVDAIIQTVCGDCKKAEVCRKNRRIPNYEIDNYTVVSSNDNKEFIVPIVRTAWCDEKEKEEC